MQAPQQTKTAEERVIDACNALAAEGKQPTGPMLREFMGGGSYSTINPALKKWREAQVEQAAPAPVVDMPGDVLEATRDAAAMIWRAANAAAEERMKPERTSLLAAKQTAEADLQTANESIADLEAEAARKDARTAELEAQLKDVQKLERAKKAAETKLATAKAAHEAEIKGLMARLEDAQATIEALTARIPGQKGKA